MSARFAALLVLLVGEIAWGAEGAARLVHAQGRVWMRPPGAAESAASVGASLLPGTQIRTGADGAAEVAFDDGSTLKMQKNSSILLSGNKRQQKKSSILLFFGRLWSKVSPSTTGGTSYEVSTPNAVCGVRGTEFETAVADDGSLRLRVSEGKVAVEGDGGQELAAAGQQVEADESGIDDVEATDATSHEAWSGQKRERLRTGGESIVKSIKGKVMSRKDRLEALRARQQEIQVQRRRLEEQAQAGEPGAIDELRKLNTELARLADEIADLGDVVTTQIGIVDHFADLASDPRFKMVGRKYIEMEAANLRRVRADLDKLVAEGTDISIEAMEKMLEEMGKGKPTLRDKKGSTTQDLFGPDDMDMH